MTPLTRRWLILLSIIALVLLADQVTKRVVIDDLQLGESVQPVPALFPYFQITRSENNGAAFGFLPQAGDLFLIIALIVSVIMLVYFPRIPAKDRLTRLGLGLVVGGALGNAVDRLTHGAVIDFIHYQIPGVISNVSNLADHAIVIGVILIVLQSWRSDAGKAAQPEMPDTPDETGG
ncbi:MAG: signal peptidase II [Anaerolineae bacterium]|nr:signal peptidase II [Anaerolineae bacterium]